MKMTSTDTDSKILAPDFYDYPWEPIVSLDQSENFLHLHWSDNISLSCYVLWLRENAIGAGGIDEATREGIFEPKYFCRDIKFNKVEITDEGALIITWESDGLTASYHPGWLRHIALNQHTVDSFTPEIATWTSEEFSEPSRFDAKKILECQKSKKEWINTLISKGIAKLQNAPDDVNFLNEVSEAVGPIRSTNFGGIWDVKADVKLAGSADTNSTANTSLALSPHTDLPTRETPPGFQFLHCLKNETRGGESTMTDGYAVVETLKADWPEDYQILTTCNWIFFNRGPGIDHRWSGPIIELAEFGRPLTLRAFYPVRAFPDMPQNKIPMAYSAMQRLYKLASDSRFQIQFPFEPGDVVCFDNRRILHGRNAFDGSGSRHLRGIYIDRDEILSCARIMNRAIKNK